MKKIISLALVLCILCLTLVGCGKISESYANKINEAAKAGEHYTYDKVVEDLGDNAVDITVLKTGVIVAVKGVTTYDELKEKVNSEEDIKGIIVVMVAGKATSAKYDVITADDIKK